MSARIKLALAAGVFALVAGLLAWNVSLQRKVATQAVQIDALSAARRTDNKAFTQGGKIAQEARTRSAEAQRKLNEAQADPAVRDWLDSPLPDGVREALRRGP